MSRSVTPTLLLILDGWGQAPAGPGNALSLAATPHMDALMELPSRAELLCSGRAVGLPSGYMGNSEVGHTNIGAGRIVYQDMTRIDLAMEDGSFAVNPVIVETMATVKQKGGVLHLMGLLSDGGVHSHINHLFALLAISDKTGVPSAIHAFMDGRDTAPDSGIHFMRQLSARLKPGARVATISGRYYAMDRDNRWDRTRKAWDAMVNGRAPIFADAVSAVQAAYAAGESDEFITPRLIADDAHPPCLIQDGDAVFFFNFRADRARQLSRCLSDTAFAEFDRQKLPRLSAFAAMTQYDPSLPMPAVFPRQDMNNSLGQVIADAGYRQLRIAETEKYAHVTYFFNCGRDDPFPNEERRLIPSPRDVATYDLKPEMSVYEVTDTLITEWMSGAYDFVVCNLANLDMVGHTGNIPATVKACEAVDACVRRIVEAVKTRKGRLIMTADHGNAEEMLTADNHPQTAHSKNPVAVILVDDNMSCALRNGKLGDIAPTILRLWGMPVPAEMTGLCLVDQ
ncbi:MAG: 2,3-bisphosphoglycerate-independent phosphoglycerate mutase [Desulfovibrio sp.]|jgi:2,3-bisphosphoglycerate-independent phosphoglycerate mutase|nr:2,3-bisphosphoglycerate-independent phosphoglycerate mutase [Desulfovibrio sp.]